MAESYQPISKEFWPWVDANGCTYLTDADYEATTGDGLRGIVTTANIAEKTTVLHVPFSMCIHGGPEGGVVGAAIAAQESEVEPFLATVLALHFEMSGGETNRFEEFVKSLPTEVNMQEYIYTCIDKYLVYSAVHDFETLVRRRPFADHQ